MILCFTSLGEQYNSASSGFCKGNATQVSLVNLNKISQEITRTRSRWGAIANTRVVIYDLLTPSLGHQFDSRVNVYL